MFFFTTLVRSEGWMAVVALLLAVGFPATVISGVAGLLHLPPLGEYTLFACSQRLAMTFQPEVYVPIILTCLGWGAAYLLLNTWLLEHRDAA